MKGLATAAVLLAALPAWAANPCDDFVRRLPNVSRPLCQAAKLVPGAARSVKGEPLYTRDVQTEGAKLRVLVVGAIHGDELSSASVALYWIRLAQDGNAQDGTAQMPVPVHWRFIPVLNPDGALSRPPRRTNARGVDLNRNFPTPNWERDAPVYWEKRTRKDPRRWPGPKPLSEPESRFLHDQMQSFKPNLIVSIHAPMACSILTGPRCRRPSWVACTWTRWASSRARWATMAASTRAFQWSPSSCPMPCVRRWTPRRAKCGWTCCAG